ERGECFRKPCHGTRARIQKPLVGETVQQALRFVTYAWGKNHVDDPLNFALSSALAPGDLPALAKLFDCTVVIVTEESFFGDDAARRVGRVPKTLTLLSTADHCFGAAPDFGAGGVACALGTLSLGSTGGAAGAGGCGAAGAAWPNETESPN